MKHLPVSAIVMASALLASGCTFVEPTAEAKKVRVLSAQEVVRCKHLGSVTSSVADHVGFIMRGEKKVKEDVITNAMNSAADMGGDTIVPTTKLDKGKQTFDVYRCINP